MERNQLYRYNPETDNFERVFPTLKRRAIIATRYLVVSLIIAGLLFLFFYYVVDSPGERRLREENAALKQQYEILNRRFDNAQKVLDNIQSRDENFYRVMLQMDPVNDAHRYAGLNNDKRYRELSNMSDGGLVKFMTQRMDFLERQIYAQSLSFDDIKQTATQQRGKLDHIPSRMPVQLDVAVLSGGYGMRRDPVNEMAKFHAGLDFAAPEGTPVFATADGKVTVSERRNMFGLVVEIDHGYNYLTRYAHLSETLVKAGESVKKGQLIGKVGSTGRSTASHLHYEVRFKNEPQNPVNYSFTDLNPEQYADFAAKAENAGDIMD